MAHHRLELKYKYLITANKHLEILPNDIKRLKMKSKSSIGSGSLKYLISSAVSGAFLRPSQRRDSCLFLWKHNSWQLCIHSPNYPVLLFNQPQNHKNPELRSKSNCPLFCCSPRPLPMRCCGFGKTSVLHLDES